MDKYRAIPQAYMTVGQLAKKMNTTVRTLQYYDKEGVLSPSCVSEGGRRLYTAKDLIHLHQIQSLKYLGFSLNDIKQRLVSLETTAQVAEALEAQEFTIREKIVQLSEVLGNLEKLKEEILQMDTVDWQKYAAIIVNLQLGNSYYSMVKYLENEDIDTLAKRFTMEEAKAIIDLIDVMLDKAIKFQNEGVDPESDPAQKLAKDFWDITMKATSGDLDLLNKLATSIDSGSALGQKQLLANKFFEAALKSYFMKNEIDPFAGGQK